MKLCQMFIGCDRGWIMLLKNFPRYSSLNKFVFMLLSCFFLLFILQQKKKFYYCFMLMGLAGRSHSLWLYSFVASHIYDDKLRCWLLLWETKHSSHIQNQNLIITNAFYSCHCHCICVHEFICFWCFGMSKKKNFFITVFYFCLRTH